MRVKVVVFPIRGRNWCFSQSIDPSLHAAGAQSSNSPSTLKELCGKMFASSSADDYARKSDTSKLEIAVDFVANKMNQSWTNLEKAPQGTLKNRIHDLGLKLLSRVKPTEIFFRSIAKEASGVDVIYPSGLNPRLVHRRLRHLASIGSVIHSKYFYGSAILLPLTSVFTILPLPNIPFFWVLFRTYSHWRASQGSEKLLFLVNAAPIPPHDDADDSKHEKQKEDASSLPSYVLQPSEELQRLIQLKGCDDGLSERAVAEICKAFHLNSSHVFKYGRSVF